MLNVNNDALIVMCEVPDGLQTDYMAIRGLETRLKETSCMWKAIT